MRNIAAAVPQEITARAGNLREDRAMAEPATATLAAALAGFVYDDVPAAVVDEAERAVLDWLGSALAGSAEPPARMARSVAERFGVSDEATVFGGQRASGVGGTIPAPACPPGGNGKGGIRFLAAAGYFCRSGIAFTHNPLRQFGCRFRAA